MLELHFLFGDGGLTVRGLAQSCLSFCLLMSALATAQEPKEPPTYSSPQEVFEAYRKAIARGDWLAAFHCLSDEAKKQAIYDVYMSGSFQLGELGKKAAKIQSEYGASSRVVEAEYQKRYLAKNANGTSDGIGDGGIEVLKEILDERIDDTLGFYVATQKLLADPKSTPTLGSLGQVGVAENLAKGQAQVTVYVFSAENGGPVERKESKVVETFDFCKVGKGWLIDVKRK